MSISTHREKVWPSIIASSTAALGSISFGYALGYSSPVQQQLTSDDGSIHLTDAQFSWFASILGIGAAFGGLLGSWMMDTFGRKIALLLCCLPFTIGWLLISSAQYSWMLYCGRIISGIGLGCSSLLVPVYISEIASAKYRGALSTIGQLAIDSGTLIGFIVGLLTSWRMTAAVALVPVFCLLVFMFFMPDSPRWLLQNKMPKNALESLRWLRGNKCDIETECSNIKSSLDNQEKMSFEEFRKPSILRPLSLGIRLMFFQQFCGINFLVFYASQIFKSSGLSQTDLITVILGIFKVCASGLSCFLIDKAGRKILLVISASGMGLCCLALGFYYYFLPHFSDASGNVTSNIRWVAIVSVIFYCMMFSLGWGSIPWLYMSELFPPRARASASGITALFCWTFAFTVTVVVPYLQNLFTVKGTYWFFAAWNVLAVTFVIFSMPETKGKTLEEIEIYFDPKKLHPATKELQP